MPRGQHVSDPDAEGWHTVGSSRGKPLETRGGTSSRRLVGQSVVPMATEDRPGAVADVSELHAPAAAEGDGAPAVLASRRQ